MKYLSFLVTILVTAQISYAQLKLEQRIDIDSNQPFKMQFDEASLVHISSWNERYIFIEATININGNMNNDAYKLVETSDQKLKAIRGYIDGKEDLPQMIRIKRGDEIYTFQTDDYNNPEIQEFYAKYGQQGIGWVSHGVHWDITLDVKVPTGSNMQVLSKHGIIELVKVTGQVQATSKHGGIDVTVDSNVPSTIDAQTKWGSIYSNVNLDLDYRLSSEHDWNHVVGYINGGKENNFVLEAKHANIYLRKAE